MWDIRELYNEVLEEHDKKPRNFRKMELANRKSVGFNPVCGDKLVVYLQDEDGIIKDISFEGEGCRISKAAASMMTQALKGKSRKEAETLFDEFHRMVTGDLDEQVTPNQLGHLKIFAGVRKIPVRVKCASLAWHTMHAALNNEEIVSTE
ncbi:MAG: Fe-S cluster assembly sulfur transfer protein SufU [Pyrinomonadaceae bacterium]